MFAPPARCDEAVVVLLAPVYDAMFLDLAAQHCTRLWARYTQLGGEDRRNVR